MKSSVKAVLPLVIIFILASAFFVTAVHILNRFNIDQGLVITGNCILFLVTLASFYLFKKALYAPNTHAFLRNVYSALFVKFFIVLAVAFIYIYFSGNALNKAGFIIITLLYFVYMFFEVALLMNQSRQIRNAKNA